MYCSSIESNEPVGGLDHKMSKCTYIVKGRNIHRKITATKQSNIWQVFNLLPALSLRIPLQENLTVHHWAHNMTSSNSVRMNNTPPGPPTFLTSDSQAQALFTATNNSQRQSQQGRPIDRNNPLSLSCCNSKKEMLQQSGNFYFRSVHSFLYLKQQCLISVISSSDHTQLSTGMMNTYCGLSLPWSPYIKDSLLPSVNSSSHTVIHQCPFPSDLLPWPSVQSCTMKISQPRGVKRMTCRHCIFTRQREPWPLIQT